MIRFFRWLIDWFLSLFRVTPDPPQLPPSVPIPAHELQDPDHKHSLDGQCAFNGEACAFDTEEDE